MKPALIIALALLGLAACTEKPQELYQGKAEVAEPAYKGTGSSFTAPGWTAGDKSSWEQTLKVRAEKQNEYVRIR